jgi:hypothetical protein
MRKPVKWFLKLDLSLRLLAFALYAGLFGFQCFNGIAQLLQRARIKGRVCEPFVSFDFCIEFIAQVTHGSSAEAGGRTTCLSVADRCLGRFGDGAILSQMNGTRHIDYKLGLFLYWNNSVTTPI